MAPTQPHRNRSARRIARLLAACVAVFAVTTGTAFAATTLLRLSGLTPGVYSDGAVVGNWKVEWAGYGSVTVGAAGSDMTLAPAPATSEWDTHSALVVSTKVVPASATLRATVTTLDQLRENSAPNTWETGWLVFNYTDPEHFYYLALKTNGWELGKRDPAYPGGQRFLATGSTPAAKVGTGQSVVITTANNRMTATISGVRVASFTDRERPYLGGKAGLYTEDAAVKFSALTVTTP